MPLRQAAKLSGTFITRYAPADNRYRPIIGDFADNWYWPINTLVSIDCRLYSWQSTSFYFYYQK